MLSSGAPMPPKPKAPAIGERLRGTVAYAVRSREGLREGLRDAQSARLHAPPAEEHARRLLFGLSLPVTLLRIAWADAQIKRSIVRRLAAPLACVALFAVVGIGSMTTDLLRARHQPLALKVDAEDDDDEDKDRDESVESEDDVKAAVAGVASAVREAKGKGESGLDVSTDALTSAAKTVHERKKAARAKAASTEAPTRFPVLAAILGFVESKIAKLIATLSVLEWILVWIGREHHDQIAYEVSELTGVPGEALARPPRLRLDAGWLKMKGWRALRFLIFLGLASPIAWLAGKVPHTGDVLDFVVEGAWAAYWASVFAVGNSFLVWERPLAPGEAPWFIRGLRRLGTIPLLGIPARLYERVLTFATRNVWPACMAFEETVWESAGLAALRGIASVPVVYIVTRPFFSPAATHAFLGRVPLTPPTGDERSRTSETPA
jgi:hypothetical protein